MALKKGPRRGARNPEIARGIRRYSSTTNDKSRRIYKKAKLGSAGKSTPKAAVAPRKNEPRWYSTDDAKIPLKSKKNNKTAKLRKSIQAGTVVIILAGRFRGKRVIVLKQLASGLLLVTGPYKINGVPLRRVNQAYVIATSTKVDVSKVDVSSIDDKFFAKAKNASKKSGEFFDAAEKKTELPKERVDANKKVDTALRAVIKATPMLRQYLNAKFTLTKGQYPHQLQF